MMRCMRRRMQWLLLVVSVALSVALSSAAPASAASARGVVVPLLLDFQPVVLTLDLTTSDLPAQLTRFCGDHHLDSSRCVHVLENALAHIVQVDNASDRSGTVCRVQSEPVAPSFALIKNLLVTTHDSSDHQQLHASFQWLPDSPRNIASDICGFLARSPQVSAHISSTTNCVDPLATAFALSVDHINAIAVCSRGSSASRNSGKIGAVRLPPRLTATQKPTVRLAHVDLKPNVAIATKAKMTTPVGAAPITITPWQLTESELLTEPVDGNVDANRDADDDGEEQDRVLVADRPIRLVAMDDDDQEITMRDAGTTSSDSTTQKVDDSSYLLPAAVLCMAISTVTLVLRPRWVAAVVAMHSSNFKPLPVNTAAASRIRSSDGVVAPVDASLHRHSTVATTTLSAAAAALPSQCSDALTKLSQVTRRMLLRSAVRQWRQRTTQRRSGTLCVQTDAALLANHASAPVVSAPSTPLSSSSSSSSFSSSAAPTRRRRAPSFPLAAMSFMLTPRSLVATPSSSSCDSPLARVTRLLETDSSTSSLLDQFENERRVADRQCIAARQIQRAWRSWLRLHPSSSSSSTTGEGAAHADTVKPKPSHRQQHLPDRAVRLLHEMRRLHSRFSLFTHDDPADRQSASSA